MSIFKRTTTTLWITLQPATFDGIRTRSEVRRRPTPADRATASIVVVVIDTKTTTTTTTTTHNNNNNNNNNNHNNNNDEQPTNLRRAGIGGGSARDQLGQHAGGVELDHVHKLRFLWLLLLLLL
jgi:hypothetical protein